MTNNEKLIVFMWEKQRILQENGIDLPYMSEQIEKEMLKWNEGECKVIYEKIKENISYIFGFLDCRVCPFCLKHTNLSFTIDCVKCEYKEINGKCDAYSTDNLYGKIIEKVEERWMSGDFVKNPTQTYKEIIDKIDGITEFTTWKTKTSDEIIADINKFVNVVITATKRK